MLQKIMVLFFASVMFVACSQKKDAQSFEKALESKGQTYTIVKLETEKGSFAVYRNDVTGEYVAYNLDKWDRKTMTTLEQFMANGAVDGVDVVRNLKSDTVWVNDGYWESVYSTVSDTYSYYDDYCECWETETDYRDVYMGERYVDTSHWYTYYTGGGFRFDNTSSQSKDLDTIAALKEEAAQKFMSYKLKSEFSLSADRADELAKLASRYQKLENSRELTSPEKDKFAMDALGVSMNQVESALKAKAQGNDSRYDQLLETAAKTNNTTPDQIGKFFTEMEIKEI
jgi:uncharacterized lipoprotein YehR (DUF1307 family)